MGYKQGRVEVLFISQNINVYSANNDILGYYMVQKTHLHAIICVISFNIYYWPQQSYPLPITIPVTCLQHLLQVLYRLSTVIIKSYPHITPTSQHFSCGLLGIYQHDLLILYCWLSVYYIVIHTFMLFNICW